MIDVEEGVTEIQLQLEKTYNNIVDSYESLEISKDEANEQLEELLEDAYAKDILSDDDHKNYDYRRDPKGIRTHIDFALKMRKSHNDEKKTLEYFCEWIRKKGKIIRYESLGSDDVGHILLANVRKRKKSPMNPDYRVWIDEEFLRLEIKNFTGEIWLKISSLKKYQKTKAFMTLSFDGLYYLFKKKAITYMLDNVARPYKERKGKPSIIINARGGRADYSLRKMVEDGLVTMMT